MAANFAKLVEKANRPHFGRRDRRELLAAVGVLPDDSDGLAVAGVSDHPGLFRTPKKRLEGREIVGLHEPFYKASCQPVRKHLDPDRTRRRSWIPHEERHLVIDNPNVGLIGDPVTPVEMDYLSLGLCVNDDIYWDLLTYFDLERMDLNDKIFIHNRRIWLDNKEVGQIAGSQGAKSHYGRKILFHFTGQFFRNRYRTAEDPKGERLAFWVVRAVEAAIMSLPVVSVEERSRSDYEIWLQSAQAIGEQSALSEEERAYELAQDELRLVQSRLWDNREAAWSASDDYADALKAERVELELEVERLEAGLRRFVVARLDRSARFYQWSCERVMQEFEDHHARKPFFDFGWRKSVDRRLELAQKAQDIGDLEESARNREIAYRDLLKLTIEQLDKAGYKSSVPISTPHQVEAAKKHKRVIEAMSKLVGKPFVNFVSIDRVDYSINCLTGRAITPYDVANNAILLDGWRSVDTQDSVDGISSYFGTCDRILKQRGKYPHLIVYQDAELSAAGLLRLEMRLPAVRTTSGNAGCEAAARLAAQVFSQILARPVAVDDDPNFRREDYNPSDGYVNSKPDNILTVYPIDPGKFWMPDHVASRLYKGHGRDTVRRLGRMVATTFNRLVGAVISASDYEIATPKMTPDDLDDRLDLSGAIRLDDLELIEQAALALRRVETPEVAPLALRVRTSHVGSRPVPLRPALPPQLQPYARVAGWDGDEGATPPVVVLPALPRRDVQLAPRELVPDVVVYKPALPPGEVPAAAAYAWRRVPLNKRDRWCGGSRMVRLAAALPPSPSDRVCVAGWDGGELATPPAAVLPGLPRRDVSIGSAPLSPVVAWTHRELRPARHNSLDSYLMEWEATQEIASKAWAGRYKRPLPVTIAATHTLQLDYEVSARAGDPWVVPPVYDPSMALVMRFPTHYARSRYLHEWRRWETGERTRPPRWAVRASHLGSPHPLPATLSKLAADAVPVGADSLPAEI